MPDAGAGSWRGQPRCYAGGVRVWCRAWILGVLAVAGCAQPSAANGAMTGGDGGGGSGDDLAHGGAGGDLGGGARCGDHVCAAAESCDHCPEDCGACNDGCAAGHADCNHNPADGCETDLSTIANCGACDRVCIPAGGSNSCVAAGASWVCRPACDGNHADCDGDPIDGCEVDVSTSSNCGACGFACVNTHGTTTCSAGSGGHACTATCSFPWADCSQPSAPAADDGCETNGTLDSGGNDDSCSGRLTTLEEGATIALTDRRILPGGDRDVVHVRLNEATHSCGAGAAQSFAMRVTLVPPAGTDLRLGYNLINCNDTWRSDRGNGFCEQWSGTCGLDDGRDFYFQVFGASAANSCNDYTLTITFAAEGTGCPP
jgi:hypothetical protein